MKWTDQNATSCQACGRKIKGYEIMKYRNEHFDLELCGPCYLMFPEILKMSTWLLEKIVEIQRKEQSHDTR